MEFPDALNIIKRRRECLKQTPFCNHVCHCCEFSEQSLCNLIEAHQMAVFALEQLIKAEVSDD